MKPNYEISEWSDRNKYCLKYTYWRAPRTQNEYRQNRCALADGHKVRGRRRILPTTWDDLTPSFNYGRCWKRFTKRKYQYKPRSSSG